MEGVTHGRPDPPSPFASTQDWPGGLALPLTLSTIRGYQPIFLAPLCTRVFGENCWLEVFCQGMGEGQRAGMGGGRETEKYAPLQLFPILISSEWFLIPSQSLNALAWQTRVSFHP